MKDENIINNPHEVFVLHPSSFIFHLFLFVLLAIIAGATTANAQQSDVPLKTIAQNADAYIGYDAATNTWEIGTNAIRRRMDYRPGAGFRLTRLTNKSTGREWLAPGSGTSAELNMQIAGQTITGSSRDFALVGYSTKQNIDGSLELIVSLRHTQQLIAHLHYIAFPGTSVIEQWAEIENAGATPLLDLVAMDSISVALRPSAESLMLYWVQGLSPDISTDQQDPVPALRLHSLKLDNGVAQDIGSQGRSSEDCMGWFALAAPSLREGLFGGIEWSGDWDLRAARDANQTTLEAGLKNIRHTLAPGEIFSAPRRFLGFYRGDLDDAANASHTFARLFLLRPHPADFPWTQYNTWFAHYGTLREDVLRREVDIAAELGLEAFVLDAGWYEGSHDHGEFSFGLGTWREDTTKFPSGIADFSDYVHAKGLKFGLWVEPERVDLDAIKLGEEVMPEWLAPGTDFNATPPPDTPRTTQVCLGNPEARAWVKGWLTRIIRDYHVDWLKWDNNAWYTCNPPGQTGDADYAHVLGLYEILDYLHQEFPNLIVENCASGGNRMDYALMRRTDIAWLSDQTDPSYRVRYHVTGASYPFPNEYLNSWIVESYWEHLADAQDNPEELRAWLRSRMMGAFGISMVMLGWDENTRQVAADEIKEYKNLRQLIADGKRYQLLPQNNLEENLQPPDEPDAAEFFDPIQNKGVVFLFRGQVAWKDRRVLLKGLNPAAFYEIRTIDGTAVVRETGRQAMSQPFLFPYADTPPSTLLLITPITNQPDSLSEPVPVR